MAGFFNSITIALFFLASVLAGPLEPRITPAPLVRRSEVIIGWYADGVVGGSTIWSPEYCSTGYTLFSASSYYKCCSTIGACSLYTGCSGSYLLGQNTQVNCPSDLGAEYPSCSYDLLYASTGALAASTYFWCASAGETGTFYYAESPTAGEAATTSSTTSTPSTTTTSPTSSTTPPTPPPTPTSSPSNAGAIAGGVVGGIALIAIIAGLAAFFIIRNRKQQQAQPAASTAPPPSDPPPQTEAQGAITTGPMYSGPSEKLAPQGTPPQPYYPSGTPQPEYSTGMSQPNYPVQPMYASHEQPYPQTFSPTVPSYTPQEQRALSPDPPNAVELESGSSPHSPHLSP